MTEVNQAAATRKVLTRDEKIAQFYEKSADYLTKAKALEAERDAEAKLANLSAGDTVEFDLGRAATFRTLIGSIVAVGEVEGKQVAKILSGSGLETAVYQLPVSALRLPAPAEEVVESAADPVNELDVGIDDLLSNVSPETEAALAAVVL